MIKYFLLVLLVAACAGMGNAYALTVGERARAARELEGGVKRVKNALEYEKLSLPDALAKTELPLFERCAALLRSSRSSGGEAALGACAECGQSLPEESKELFRAFVESVATAYSAKEAADAAEVFLRETAETLSRIENGELKKAGLARRIGLIAGLAAAIILV